MTDVGSPTYPVNLLDVCSYPSLQPNSDPSDCVIRSKTKGNLEIHKDVVPDNNATNWLINVTGPSPFSYTLMGDDTTFNKIVTPGLYTITEAAGANTSSGYLSSWRCVNSAPVPAVVVQGTGRTIPNLNVVAGSVWDCFFTNEVKVDLTVTKTDKVTSWPWIKRIGTPFLYTIQINRVDGVVAVTAFDVSLVDTLDAWLDYRSDETAYPYTVKINGVAVSPQPLCTWVDDAVVDGRGGTFSCADIGDLGSSDVATVTFWVMPVTGAPVWNFVENGTCTQNPNLQGTTPVDICNVVSVATSSPEVLYTNNQDSEPADIGLPTAVSLGWFDVTKKGTAGITLGWETVNESEVLSFNLYRAGSNNVDKKKLIAADIPAQKPGELTGAVYSFKDKTLKPDKTYYYWLETFDREGGVELVGPVKARLKK